jgi:phage/conjugal plasmid C-4 type zinc finger TraR family protein
MDIIDQAQEHEERLRSEAIANATIKPGKEPALWYCEDCFVGIPEARRVAVPHCTRCVDCQEIHEIRGRV